MLTTIKDLYVRSINFLAAYGAPHDFNDVLIIRLDELGDFVLWLDSAKEYRKIFPNKRITLLVNEKWIQLARQFTYWDDVMGIDTFKFRVNPFYRYQWLRFITLANFETTVSPRYFTQRLLEPAIMTICRSENKIIYGGHFPREGRFSKVVHPQYGTVHELIRNADFIRALGQKDYKARVPNLSFLKNPKKANYCVICPTSFRKEKNWQIEKFDELRKRIGIESYYVLGYMDLMNFISLIAGAKLVIGNDSGPIHVAAALGVPSVCIGVGKHGKMFHPYEVEEESQDDVLPKVIWNQDIKSITVDEVWDIVKEMI